MNPRKQNKDVAVAGSERPIKRHNGWHDDLGAAVLSDGVASVDHAIEMVEVETADGADVVQPAPVRAAPRRRWSPISLTLVLCAAAATAYVAFERIGTTANADSVEYTRNYAGGFLAVGMTEDQPGFIVLSLLEQDEVELNADQVMNRLAGSHTVVEFQTSLGTTRTRLRGPQVILVSKDGAVEEHRVDWTLDEFNALREAADCSHEAAYKKHRCGAPFADLHDAFAEWPHGRVPERIRAFVTPFADHVTTENKND